MLFSGLQLFLMLIIIRPQDFITWMRGAPVVFIVMGCLLVGWLLSKIEKELIKTTLDKFFAIFLAMSVISTLNAGWLGYLHEMTVETFKLALIYCFIITIVDNDIKFKKATWTIIVLMTVVALMGIMQYFGYDITGNGMTWAPDKKVWQIKGAGNFDNPNDMAYSVVLIVPFAIGLLISGKNIFVRSFALFILLIALYCIYLTKSRGGYLAACMACVTWFYFWISNQNLRRFALLLGLIGIVGAFSIQTSNYRADKSSMGRVEAWADGMNMMSEHPIIGVGKGRFLEYHIRDSHNSYVRAGAELGIIGLYAYIGILYATFKSLIRESSKKNSDNWRLYRIGYISYFSSYCVASIFSTRTYDIVFMVLVALVSAFVRMQQYNIEQCKYEKTMIHESVWNINTITLTVLTIVIWKIFLIQVW